MHPALSGHHQCRQGNIFWLSIVTSPQLICDVARTPGTSIVLPYSPIVLARANWHKRRYSLVNNNRGYRFINKNIMESKLHVIFMSFSVSVKLKRHCDDDTKWKHFPRYWPLCGEFTGFRWNPAQRPVSRRFDVFFDLQLIKRLSKHSRGWWFETLLSPLWRHCNIPQTYTAVAWVPLWWCIHKLAWAPNTVCSRFMPPGELCFGVIEWEF